MARNTNKMYEPLTHVNPGVCPKCLKPTMVIDEQDRIFALIDEDGIAGHFIVTTTKIFSCLSCGFTSTSYVPTDKGYRYSPSGDDKYIIEQNRTLNPTTDTTNYLVKETKQNDSTCSISHTRIEPH